MTDIMILKAAAQRVSAWADRYGVYGDLYLTQMGVTIQASSGGNHVSRTVPWFELEQARYPAHVLDRLEEAVLRGLSD